MTSEASSALRELRDTLRQPVASTEILISSLSTVLSALDLHPTSVAPPTVSSDTLKSIQRYLPAIQLSLLTVALPTFLPALDEKELALVDRFFCPPKTSNLGGLRIARELAAVSYATLPTLLSVKAGGEVATGLPDPSRDYLLSVLSKLASTYGIDDLYWSTWAGGDGAEGSKDGGLRALKWEEAVKAATSLPAKVANAVGRWSADGWKGTAPLTLVPKSYFERTVSKLEELMYELKSDPSSTDRIQLVLHRLASLGLFSLGSNIDLMSTLLPLILYHLHPPSPLSPYPPTYLPTIFLGLPTSILNPLVSSFVRHLALHIQNLSPDTPDERIRRGAQVLTSIVGPARVGGEAWDAVLRLALAPTSRVDAQTRLIVAWISASSSAVQPFIEAILSVWTSPKHVKYALYTPQFQLTYTLILAISLLPPFHPFLLSVSTRPAFLLSCQSYLSHPDGSVRRLGLLVAEMLSELTIVDTGDGLEYDEKKDTEELMQGLEIDEDTGKPKAGAGQKAPKGMKRLKFGGGMWDGVGDGREEARWLRSALGVRDGEAILSEGGDWMLGWTLVKGGDQVYKIVSIISDRPAFRGRADKPRQPKSTASKPKPKIVMLDADQSSDPLLSYSPPHSPSSSRSASPTPSYLDEIAADPSLALDATQKKKVVRPVYIPQLLQLLREKDNPDAIEMAMKHGEPLIRAKRGFGLELAENAVPLAAHLMGMSNQYGLDEWEEKRQEMVTALVACAPRQVAPFLAEKYFINSHSLQQKSIMLTAISMGARELAGLIVPDITTRRIDFPSRTLPPGLHRKFISAADNHPAERTNNQIEAAAQGMRGTLLDKGARRAAEVLPDVAREKRLRVGPSASVKPGKGMGIAEVGSLRDRQLLERRHKEESDQLQRKTQTPIVAYFSIAAEYFIMPLVNRFWMHFQDDHIRENRALALGTRFRGAGAGMVLSPLALEKFLMTLALLVHAARNAPAFLAVLAPEAMELGVTVGSRHLNRPEVNDEMGPDGDDGSRAESQVVGSALELVLVALDLSGEIDGGRTMMGDRHELVMAAGEWARGVFEVESEGGKVVGGQGGREGRIKGAAAGVVVRIGEMMEKWGSRR